MEIWIFVGLVVFASGCACWSWRRASQVWRDAATEWERTARLEHESHASTIRMMAEVLANKNRTIDSLSREVKRLSPSVVTYRAAADIVAGKIVTLNQDGTVSVATGAVGETPIGVKLG